MKRLILFCIIIYHLFIIETVLGFNYKHDDYSYSYHSILCKDSYDPYEKINRKFFAFNVLLDQFIIRPISIGYRKLTNEYVRDRVSSFVENVNMPLTTVNYALQMNYNQTIRSFWRFVINSTFGILGIFDIASKIGLVVTTQNFGNTLASYGVGPGPYIVLPFFGGTTTRDISAPMFTDTLLNPLISSTHLDFQISFAFIQLIDKRTNILSFTNYISQSSTDQYIAMRSIIHQNRESILLYPKNFRCLYKN